MVRLGALLFSIFLSFTHLSAVVFEASNLEIIEKYIESLDQEALVVFDVDYTLLVPTDLILSPSGEKYFQSFMKKLRDLGEKGEILGSQIALQGEVSLVDKKILDILNSLKEKKIKAIALTAMPTGSFGLIPVAEDWRVQQLNSLGIYLGGSFNIDYIVFEEFEGKKSPPVFKQGILASAKYPKGEVLSAFLKKTGYRPSHVVFIDDRMEYIDSVECELSKQNIKHTSFYYTAATDLSKNIDQKLADFQFDYLIKNGSWLNDENAKNKMKENHSPDE